jgi:hypothetical protein
MFLSYEFPIRSAAPGEKIMIGLFAAGIAIAFCGRKIQGANKKTPGFRGKKHNSGLSGLIHQSQLHATNSVTNNQIALQSITSIIPMMKRL